MLSIAYIFQSVAWPIQISQTPGQNPYLPITIFCVLKLPSVLVTFTA